MSLTRHVRRFAVVIAATLASGCAGDVVDSPRPTRALEISRIAELELGGSAVSIALADRVVYLGLAEGGVVAIDVSEPRAPELLAKVADVRADALAFSEDRLFALGRAKALDLGGQATLTPLDVIDPRAPVPLESRAIDGACCLAAAAARSMAGAGTRLLVGAENKRPVSFSVAAKGDAVIAAAWRGERLVALTAPETRWLGDSSRAIVLRYFDVKGKPGGALPLAGGEAAPRCGDAGALVTAQRAFVAVADHVFVVAVDAAAGPTAYESIPLRGARRVALGEGILAALDAGGLAAIDLATPTPTLGDRLSLDFAAHDVAARGEFIFVAGGERGLRIYQVARPTPSETTGG